MNPFLHNFHSNLNRPIIKSTAPHHPPPPPSPPPQRLVSLDRELTGLKDKQRGITEKWQVEKEEMGKLQAIKEEIERVNIEVQQAERDYDLNRWGVVCGWVGGWVGWGVVTWRRFESGIV